MGEYLYSNLPIGTGGKMQMSIHLIDNFKKEKNKKPSINL